MKVAICISGHFRTTTLYDNLKTNIIDVLTKNNIEVDIFISIWSSEGFRENNFEGGISIDTIINKYKPIELEVERDSREEFLNKYKSLFINQNMSPETPGDATSMWYKLWRCKEMVIKHSILKNKDYDLIFRVRSDIIMNEKLDISHVFDSINKKCLYMPIFHEKYQDVTMGMMDQYFFGPTEIMDTLLDLYIFIPDYLKQWGIPHTAEGFLYKRIKDTDIKVERFKTSYDVLRTYGKIEKVL